jgi:hypothetical protein
VAGTNLQVVLEVRGAFPGLEGDTTNQFPWSVFGRVGVGAFVVALQSCPHVIGQPDVRLIGVGQTSEQIDMVNGFTQCWLAILLRSKVTEDKYVARSAIHQTALLRPASRRAT